MKLGEPNVRLFIVPWPCAGASTALPNARSRQSAIRLEVSTLPATTAAGDLAFTSDPSGALTSIGAYAPPDAGASGSATTRRTKQHADTVTASGQLRLPPCCGAVPSKSTLTRSPAISIAARISRSSSAASTVSVAS